MWAFWAMEGVASANAGLPMIALLYPGMMVAFLPVVFLESFLIHAGQSLGLKKIIKAVLLSNFVSTVVGYPLVWLLMMGVQMLVGGGKAHGLESFGGKLYAVTVQAPWLIPYESSFYWMIPVASLVGLVPAFFTSVGIEGVMHQTSFKKDLDSQTIWKLTWRVNKVSYSFLGTLILIGLGYNILKQF